MRKIFLVVAGVMLVTIPLDAQIRSASASVSVTLRVIPGSVFNLDSTKVVADIFIGTSIQSTSDGITLHARREVPVRLVLFRGSLSSPIFFDDNGEVSLTAGQLKDISVIEVEYCGS